MPQGLRLTESCANRKGRSPGPAELLELQGKRIVRDSGRFPSPPRAVDHQVVAAGLQLARGSPERDGLARSRSGSGHVEQHRARSILENAAICSVAGLRIDIEIDQE